MKLGELKRAISESEAVGLDVEVALILADRKLEADLDDLRLCECGIEDGARLVVVRQKVARVLTASQDKTAKIWNASRGECSRTLSGHSGPVCSAVFSADGSAVLTASYHATAKIWNASTGECSRTLSGHSDWVFSAVFSDGCASFPRAYCPGVAKQRIPNFSGLSRPTVEPPKRP